MKLINLNNMLSFLLILLTISNKNLSLEPFIQYNNLGKMNTKDRIILEGIKHIMLKSNPIFVAEDLNSYLDPKERLDWKSVA